MNNILKAFYFYIAFFILSFKIAYSQNNIRGMYVGYEQNPFCYQNSCIIVHPEKYKLIKYRLYYKVTLNFTDSLIVITKTPVRFINDKLNREVIDSAAGGYYRYQGKYTNHEGHIFADLTNCKYCFRSATAMMTYDSIHYKFIKKSKNLILSSETEKNILFKKKRK